jgi:HlyD family secretion protein
MSDARHIPTIPPARGESSNGEMLNRVKLLRLDTQLGGAKRGGGGATWLPWMLCVLLAGSWAFVAVRMYRTTKDDSPTTSAADTAAGGKSAPQESGQTLVESKGYFTPAHKIAVSPIDVAGRIVLLNVVEGRRYEAGAVLAQIDPSSFQAVVDEAAATMSAAEKRLEAARHRREEMRPISEKPSAIRTLEVNQIKAQIQEADAQKARALDEERRLTSLAGVSGREVTQARNDFLAADARLAKLKADLEILEKGPREEKVLAVEADVKGAEADVQAARARLSQAKWRLDNCTIKAPITGTVLTKVAEQGNLVNPLAFAATSGSVCEMADLSDLEIDLKIAERQIAQLQKGQPCRIRADAYPDKTYAGVLDRIMPIANRADNTVNVRVKVKLPPGEEPGTYLKPEMGAVVSFLPMTSDKK